MACCAIAILIPLQVLAAGATPQLGFNYLGRLGVGTSCGDWGLLPQRGLPGGAPASMPLAYPIDVNAVTMESPAGPQLTAHWTWAPALITETAVRDLAHDWAHVLTRLVQLIADKPHSGGLTPSDLPLVSLSQQEIEHLERAGGMLEDILPLAPLQEGLLFHALYDPRGLDSYIGQLILRIDGVPDRAALFSAVQILLERHVNLRAGFVWEGVSQPLQIIPRHVELPSSEVDLPVRTNNGRQLLTEWLAADRVRRFDLTRPPLLRSTLVTAGPDYHVLGTHLASHSARWVVDAAASARTASALCSARGDVWAAAGDTVPRVSCVVGRSRSRCGLSGVAEGTGRCRGGHVTRAAWHFA